MARYTEIKTIPTDYLQTTTRYSQESIEPHFLIYQDAAREIFGSSPSITLALENEEPLYHEAGVFFPSDTEDKLFITSNILDRNGKKIQITLLTRAKDSSEWIPSKIDPGSAIMANGAVNHPSMDSLVICSQGSPSHPGGLISMSINPPYTTTPLLTSCHGRKFNSPNDVIFSRDGSIWFTDPNYGHEQGFRPTPELPNQIYRFDPKKQDIRVLADDLKKPNGLCLSPFGHTLYVTDTDFIRGDGQTDGRRSSHIYAYEVNTINKQPCIIRKRVFAMADTGAPDGIKCDLKGNVYSGCGDGVNIWDLTGMLIGKIIIPGGIANFCFGRAGEMFLLNEKKFWVVKINETVKGALLDESNLYQ